MITCVLVEVILMFDDLWFESFLSLSKNQNSEFTNIYSYFIFNKQIPEDKMDLFERAKLLWEVFELRN